MPLRSQKEQYVIVCWSPKGGSGSTVVSTVLAIELGRSSGRASLVDPSGDAATVLGTDAVGKPGIGEWMASSSDVPLESLRRLLIEPMPELRLLPAGTASTVVTQQTARLRDALPGPTVVDCGTSELTSNFVDVSSASIMVIRPCFLAVKRATCSGIHADGFVMVQEDGRSLDARDIEDVIGVEHFATVDWDPAVARLIDAGRMKSRLPKSLRPLQKLAARLSNQESRLAS